MSRCYFCGNEFFTDKVKFIGKQDGKRKQKTVHICLTCSAMSDDRWIEEQLDWDEGSLKTEGC